MMETNKEDAPNNLKKVLFNYKLRFIYKPNTRKLRAIIRKAKLTHDNRS